MRVRSFIVLSLVLAAGCGTEDRLLEPRFVQIDGGDRHACGVDREGRASCWGDGERGRLGAGDSVSSATPVLVAGDARFTHVSAGYARTCAVDRDGGAWCWGEHAAAPAGPGLKALTETTRAEPSRVEGAPRLVAITAGGFHACGLEANGRAWCWGSNVYGELGSGTREQGFTPVAVAEPRFSAIVAGNTHACGLDPDGNAWCWGDNQFGQLGDGAQEGRLAPVPVAGGMRFRALTAGHSHSCGLTIDGRALCWGLDAARQLGGASGDICGPNRCAVAPLPVVGDLRFRSIDAGPRHTCGVTDASETWCWGERWTYERGEAAVRPPVRAAEDLDVTALAASGRETCGITRLGEIRCFSRAEDRVGFYATMAIIGGFLLAALIVAWERRLVPTAIMMIPVSAIVAVWIMLMIPLFRFWNDLRKDETGWFFMLESLLTLLLFFMIAALGGLMFTIARIWVRRRSI